VRRTLFRTFGAFLTIENALDRRYRTINPTATSVTALSPWIIPQQPGRQVNPAIRSETPGD
jgi:hypothetical protein